MTTEGDLIRAIHADVREIRSKVDQFVLASAETKAAHEVRLQDLEAHIQHSGPTKWDAGALLTALTAIIYQLLRPDLGK